jgi:hypothetical protein
MRKLVWVFAVVVFVVAFGFGLRRAKAQITEIQPFTAIEAHVTRSVELKEPIMYTRLLAVSGHGQRYAQIQQSQLTTEVINTRTVVDKKARRKISIDPAAKMLVAHPFREDRSLIGGGNCEGTPDGQIEGLDVNFSQLPNMRSGLDTIASKQWAAPKLS